MSLPKGFGHVIVSLYFLNNYSITILVQMRSQLTTLAKDCQTTSM